MKYKYCMYNLGLKKKNFPFLPSCLITTPLYQLQQHISGSQRVSCDEMETLRSGIEEQQLCTSLNIYQDW